MTSSALNTKQNFINVARQLFAKKGVDNTTMNDIAKTALMGRRTIYTYFKNKDDLYRAVIESELNVLYERLEEVTQRDMQADEKLVLLAFTRLEAIKEVVQRNGTLRADFFRDIWKVEKVRKEFDKKEIKYLEVILKAGKEEGVFDLRGDSIKHCAQIVHYAFKGLETPVILGKIQLNYSRRTDREIISNILFEGLYPR